mmetsp:Transcript_16394/g.41710  ORF Transcript_16394/g.41710 Transcript_16394/m.41710 type:complete len:202 (-) Transcript_16394:106-711(-)
MPQSFLASWASLCRAGAAHRGTSVGTAACWHRTCRGASRSPPETPSSLPHRPTQASCRIAPRKTRGRGSGGSSKHPACPRPRTTARAPAVCSTSSATNWTRSVSSWQPRDNSRREGAQQSRSRGGTKGAAEHAQVLCERPASPHREPRSSRRHQTARHWQPSLLTNGEQRRQRSLAGPKLTGERRAQRRGRRWPPSAAPAP